MLCSKPVYLLAAPQSCDKLRWANSSVPRILGALSEQIRRAQAREFLESQAHIDNLSHDSSVALDKILDSH